MVFGGGRERPLDALEDEAPAFEGGGRENVDFFAGGGSFVVREGVLDVAWLSWVVSVSLPLSLSLP